MALHQGAVISHVVAYGPDFSLRRDDVLTIDGVEYFVMVPDIQPSVPVYRKALVEQRVTGA